MEFELLKEQHLELVLKWRTSPHITRFMYTDIDDDIEKQKKWFKSIDSDPNQLNWIIKYKNQPIGLISLTDIDMQNKRASSGFYIGDLSYSMISSRIVPYLLNFIFGKLKLNKLVIEVMSHNESMLKIDYHYGFRRVGTLKKHILKDDVYIDIEVLEILQETWLNDYEKYHNLLTSFELKEHCNE